jgi:1,4-alpha-glucan branching enzyme
MAIGASVVLSASCASRERVPSVAADGVRFSFTRAGAKSVAVAGDFNSWSASANPLARDASGRVWRGVVALPPGDHLFMFVVNGTEWVVPPVADDYMDDGFGSRNGVVIVRPRER